MCVLLMLLTMAVSNEVAFQRHDIDAFPSGYQVAVVDINGDGLSDVVALSTQADRVDWYQNPGWQRRSVARTAKNIDLAFHDIDGDGRQELALAAGFYFDESQRGGELFLLRQPADGADVWPKWQIAADPVTHRIRWGDLDGDGRKELIHAPLFGPGSRGTQEPRGAHLWAFPVPQTFGDGTVHPAKIDETLTVLHGLFVGDLDEDGRDEILTASFEGIFRFDLDGDLASGRWKKTQIAAGAAAISEKPGAARGSSEVVPGRWGQGVPFVAAIEPWHGHQLVVYTSAGGDSWDRRVLDDTLDQGHALVVADLDQDGDAEIVAGWRGGEGGLALYDPVDHGRSFRRIPIDRGIAVEGAVAADINQDGRLDLVVIGGRTNNLVWYENQAK